jgi:acyl-CoA thioester hydrolase
MTTAEPRAPASGWFEEKTFVFPLRVYYEDTDLSGIVYHASYLRFMERGRSEFLRSTGLRHQGLLDADEPLVWAIRRVSIDYRRPARVDEALEVHTNVGDLSGVRMQLNQEVRRGNDLLTSAEVVACVVTLDGSPRRIPGHVAEKLAAFMGH